MIIIFNYDQTKNRGLHVSSRAIFHALTAISLRNMLGLSFIRALRRKLLIKSVKTYLLVLTIIFFGIYKFSFKTTSSRNGERQIYSTPIGLRHAQNKSIMIESLTHESVDLSELLELLLKPWAKNQSNLVDLRKKMYGKKYNDANLTEVIFASQSSMKPGEKYRTVFFYPRGKGHINNGMHDLLPKVNAHLVTFYSTMNTLSFDTIISVARKEVKTNTLHFT
ncbi:uncharacterized protein LOC117119846 isoform X2 [Anneissia japonica]|uniref:uncharacterized protein LOC117119846 isoform X2 n=1 Tax=Anneissia japonica TaxID=1529436 RepID=UPI0014259182|nr:uncharacterized protein LOC117119846 isoform X2 [Anneissia japonica]